jgi:ATP-dependent exoDNAse (exonuclease V) beta subunit
MSKTLFAHTVIRASAGSGKTHKLTNRYLALLAAGIDPDAILATTFTRKAAGEILDRLLFRLAKAAGDARSAAQLAADIGRESLGRDQVRGLLRDLLRGLHRVRIDTLDSFFIALAGSFSLEIGLPAGWSICEPADHEALVREAVERLLDQQPEAIGKLFTLLNKGATRRSVQGELHEVIGNHYETFRGSERSAWEALSVPVPVGAEERAAALEQLRGYSFLGGRDSSFQRARDQDLADFEQENWPAFLGKGLAAKVLVNEATYYQKPIPPEVCALYETLLRHARSAIVAKLAEQTRATWEFLNRFHGELTALKQSTGALRFWEVTQTLVDALARQALPTEALAFRLDGAIEHLLLDEFQDTSLPQWRVLEPIARRITGHNAEPARSFFCVGDVKQAIYGWRGGMAEIFNTLQQALGDLEESPLDESRRSAQPIIDVVNQVFENLGRLQGMDSCQDGLAAWAERFHTHETVRKEDPGYVCLQAGPVQEDDENIGPQRKRHCEYVARKIQDLVRQVPGSSIGVLCRKNETVARMIHELRHLGVEASEEGGNPLTDSPAVEVILSLFTLADHPGHSIAWFHLKNSPFDLGDLGVDFFADADIVSRRLRHDLASVGFGVFTRNWARRLAKACNRRDLSRLQQLVEMAYAFQPRSTLRADDFVAWVRELKVPDPSSANVRVMTIHGAKGLEFDVVLLPELDISLTGQQPAFVVDRDPGSLDVTFVCRHADKITRCLLNEAERRAFDKDRQRRVEESLSLLYVAMTRARHALHMYIPGRRHSDRRDSWYNLLAQALAPDSPSTEWTKDKVLLERGNERWYAHVRHENVPAELPAPPRKTITLCPRETERGRGLEHVAPSRREGQAKVHLYKLFHPPEGSGMASGTLYHAWLETIEWLDEALPTDATLRTAAEKLRANVPADTWRDLDRLLAKFRAWLQEPQITSVLKRSAYADPQQPGYPAALAKFWTSNLRPQKVERERRFLTRDGTQFWNGSFDRVVWLGDGDRTVAADVIDFKTDDITPGDAKKLAERTEHYRPQLEAYRRAVAHLAQLPPERIATRLVFTNAGRVEELS